VDDFVKDFENIFSAFKFVDIKEKLHQVLTNTDEYIKKQKIELQKLM